MLFIGDHQWWSLPGSYGLYLIEEFGFLLPPCIQEFGLSSGIPLTRYSHRLILWVSVVPSLPMILFYIARWSSVSKRTNRAIRCLDLAYLLIIGLLTLNRISLFWDASSILLIIGPTRYCSDYEFLLVYVCVWLIVKPHISPMQGAKCIY